MSMNLNVTWWRYRDSRAAGGAAAFAKRRRASELDYELQ